VKSNVLLIVFLLSTLAYAQEIRTFTTADGQTFEDALKRFDYDNRIVELEERGKAPLDSFDPADQKFILKWNMVRGFQSKMRFKTELDRKTWARLKHEQTVTPYWMDALQTEGKEIPDHLVAMIEDYEEYTAIYLEAEGYSLTMANHNLFPLENIVVESKVFYEQEYYILPDDFFSSMDNDYRDTVTTNKVRFRVEKIPVMIPHERVILHSESAILLDHQIDRSSLETAEEEEGDDSGGTEDGGGEGGSSGGGGSSGAESIGDIVEGFGDWDDHNRRRKGKLIGAWFRIGIEGPEGKMIWRELTEPASLPKKVSWNPEPTEK
jgi:uncharacterized membrane protein YgcG